MARKIGVDFGTTNSIISFLPQGGEPQEFENHCEQSKYTRSAICYQEEDRIIGRDAKHSCDDPDAYYENFKMYLNGEGTHAWNRDKAPIEVAEDFLREFLVSEDSDYSFTTAEDDIASIALTVPAFWDESSSNMGLSQLKRVIDSLGIEQVRLLSEPQAAAAYFTWWYRKQYGNTFHGKLLVCDMGGGTFDVSLVDASEGTIKVLFNTGSGRNGLGSAGVAFDVAVCNELLSDALGLDIDLAGEHRFHKDYHTFLKRFEERKITDFTRRPRRIKAFEDIIWAEDDLALQGLPPLFEVALQESIKAKVTGEVLKETFDTHIWPTIEDVLHKLKLHQDREKQAFDAVVIVGGFGRFVLVQQAILSILGLGRDSDKVANFGGANDGHFAITRGAALVAEEAIVVEERLKHNFGLVVKYQNEEGDIELDKHLVLVPKGTIYNDEVIHPLEEHYITAGQGELPFRFFMESEEGMNHLPVRRMRIEGLKDHHRYNLGVIMDKSKVVHIIFTDQQDETESFRVTFSDLILKDGEILVTKAAAL